MKTHQFLALAIAILLCACDQALLGPVEENNALNNYDYLWQDFQEHYANFQVKNLDWEEQYHLHRANLNEGSSDQELYQALRGLLASLNDAHVSLEPYGTDLPEFDSGPAFPLEQTGSYIFDVELVINNYLEQELGRLEGTDIVYGLLANNIGYIYIQEMYDDLGFWEETMNKIMDALNGTDGLVLDIRDNNGGEDAAGQLISSYFTDQETLYMLSRYKNGPGPDDFESPRSWHIAPAKRTPYIKPMVLITDRFTISAGETFSLALKTLPQLTHVGDTTTSAFSDTVDRELPNRWGYRVPVSENRDGQGQSWEGIGLPPDDVIRNSPEEVLNGIDRMLERALSYF